MSDSDYLTLNVGGFQYRVKRNLLLKFPDSFFGKMLESGWKEATDDVVEIQRNGELFKLVHDYMYYGMLPRNDVGFSLVTDSSLLNEVVQEAEFYQLPGLVKECQGLLQTCEAEQRIKQYATVLEAIDEAKPSYSSSYNVVYKSTGPDSLLALLRSGPYAPAWVTGTLRKGCNPKIFMSTTVRNVNVDELKAAASPSPFGRGSETVFDTQVRDSLEIPASKLCGLQRIVNNIDISSLAPNMKLTLKPYKLVIYEQDGHFDSHRDTVRDERHIGTLVLILNSEYTGGELEVCHGEQKLMVTGASNWVAMYGDCVHTIHPITAGTRVSLIFDIWNEQKEVSSENEEQSSSGTKKGKDGEDEKVGDDDDDDDDDDGENVENANEGDNKDGDDEENVENAKDDDDEDDTEEESSSRSKKRSWDHLVESEDNCDDYGFWPDNQINTRFWRSRGKAKKASMTTSTVTPAVDIDNVWSKVYAALDKELEKHETVSICLEHLYPACQANPGFLKGEDAHLYQMLKDKYSLGVTAITIAKISSDDDGARFGYSEFGSNNLLDRKKNILFVPNGLNENSVLYYLPGLEYTGNESQEQESVYLVAALVVRKP